MRNVTRTPSSIPGSTGIEACNGWKKSLPASGMLSHQPSTMHQRLIPSVLLSSWTPWNWSKIQGHSTEGSPGCPTKLAAHVSTSISFSNSLWPSAPFPEEQGQFPLILALSDQNTLASSATCASWTPRAGTDVPRLSAIAEDSQPRRGWAHNLLTGQSTGWAAHALPFKPKTAFTHTHTHTKVNPCVICRYMTRLCVSSCRHKMKPFPSFCLKHLILLELGTLKLSRIACAQE